jgi:hypothetical protein
MPIYYTNANPTYTVNFDGTDILRSAEETTKERRRPQQKRGPNNKPKPEGYIPKSKRGGGDVVPTVRIDGEFPFP